MGLDRKRDDSGEIHNMIIYPVMQSYIDESQETNDWKWKKAHEGKLAVSDVAHCPRRAMLKVKGVPPSDPFDPYVRRILWSGRMAEEKMIKVLGDVYGNSLRTQVPVENDMWRGTVDFLIPEAVVEHKETAYKNFRYNNLPYEFHLSQVLMYRRLLLESGQEDIDLKAVLYYQLRANWAEFEVWSTPHSIIYEGHVTGKEKNGSIGTTLEAERAKLEEPYKEDKIPPRYETPFEKNFECTSMYYSSKKAYPGCTYWNYCWGDSEYTGKDKIDIPACKVPKDKHK